MNDLYFSVNVRQVGTYWHSRASLTRRIVAAV